jgi:hypothetical protein
MNAPKNQLGAQPSKNDFRFSHSRLAQGFFILRAENHVGLSRKSLDMGQRKEFGAQPTIEGERFLRTPDIASGGGDYE